MRRLLAALDDGEENGGRQTTPAMSWLGLRGWQYSGVASEGVPRIRQGGIPAGAVLVVRGDDLEAVMAVDARRFRRRFEAWGRYGVSAFVARDAAEVDALCESRLMAWANVLVFRREALEEAGVELVATFRTPHATLAHVELEELLRRLSGCVHEVVVNPYHEGQPGPREAS